MYEYFIVKMAGDVDWWLFWHGWERAGHAAAGRAAGRVAGHVASRVAGHAAAKSISLTLI